MNNDERDEAINKIWDVVRETQVAVATILARCPGCQDELKEHHRILDGNGSKGHKARIASLELNVKWLWAVVGGAWTVGLIALQQWLSK